jgi:hypothetical protein
MAATAWRITTGTRFLCLWCFRANWFELNLPRKRKNSSADGWNTS